MRSRITRELKQQLGQALWWIGTLELLACALIIAGVFVYFGNAGKFLPFVGAIVVFSAIMWTLAWLLGGAVWVPWRRRKRPAPL